MKIIIFIFVILIIFTKTGNVLSDTNIFNVNNIEIEEEKSKNKEKLLNKAFRKAFDELTNRLLLKEDYENVSNTNLIDIKKLISYYQIKNSKSEEEQVKTLKTVNVLFDKDKMHMFFNQKNLLYSDIINTEVILFPLLKIDEQLYIYTQNYFYENWGKESNNELIKYILPTENIENIQLINNNKENIYKLDIANFFREYDNQNIVFVYIEIKKKSAEVFLSTKIENKRINKNLTFKNDSNLKEESFFNKIISEVNILIKDLIKSQNLIDVKTPAFLNAQIKIDKNKNNLFMFNERLQKIDLVDNFYVQELNKDYVLVKIKYLGKIRKIIDKFKDQNIDLIMKDGMWQLNII